MWIRVKFKEIYIASILPTDTEGIKYFYNKSLLLMLKHLSFMLFISQFEGKELRNVTFIFLNDILSWKEMPDKVY